MRVVIVARSEIPGAVEVVRKVMKLLSTEEVLLERKLAKKLGKPPGNPQLFKKADAVVSVGGDGTVLFAQRLVPNAPILGINLGDRGFLADVSKDEIERALADFKAGKLQVVERDRLCGKVSKKRLPDALNDVVVSSATPGKTVVLKVSVDGKEAMDVRGDGVVVATSTGSTAYAYAAGGPVVDPRLSAILVVPICPIHSKPTPLVVPIDSYIEIEPIKIGRDGQVFVDGIPETRLRCGEKLMLSRSENPAKFFKWGEFYRKLKEKLL